MIRRVIAVILALAVAWPAGPGSALACSRLLWNNNDRAVLVARTMDLFRSDDARIMVTPRGLARRAVATDAPGLRWKVRFGSVCVTAGPASAGLIASDGLNEKGLVVNQLYLTGAQFEPPDRRPALANLSLVNYTLDNFATVREAVAGLSKVRIVSAQLYNVSWPTHLSLADASGDSAIIEFIDGQRLVHYGRDFRVMTNEPRIEAQLQNLRRYKLFGGDLPMPGDIDPQSRFVRAASYLGTLPAPETTAEAVASLYSVAGNVAVPYGAVDTSTVVESDDHWPTLWTTVADSTHRVYYFHSSKSPSYYWVDLSKVALGAGNPARSIDAYSTNLAGDISGRFGRR